jgi:asparagine synthase (glutamine-hydrolysing)
MCGIAGFFSSNNVFSKEELNKMTNVIVHRGPDAEGHFVDEFVGLGHRRLSIIDLSVGANQPMYSQSGEHVIVYNGEVYNFQEIAKDLEINLKTSSDTEVLLEAFEKWGASFVNRINGMFAIAIYNIENKKLHIFRDRIGIKPLYYFFDGKNFAFSSELKSMLQLYFINKSKKLNHQAINQYLYLGYIPEPNSIWENIHKFPSGSYAEISENSMKIERYWKIEDKIKAEMVSDFATAKKDLKNLLIKSVEKRLICDVPFGTFLSGGIDSSLVTAIAQSVSKEPVKTFSIGFKEGKFNESNYAKQVAKHLKTDHHEFIVSQNDALQFVETLIDSYDEPYADSSAIPTMFVSKLAKQYVTMTLSGDGGDELFHGYGAYNWANRLSNPMVYAMRFPIANALSLMSNKYKRGAKVFQIPYKKHFKSHIFSQEQYLFGKNDIKKCLNPKYQKKFTLDENYTLNRKLNPAESQSLFDIKYYLKDDLLVKVDRASMKFSLETRVPLLDYEVVEYALNINPNLKMQNGIQKHILKEVLYDFVPREMFERPKWGFSIPLSSWLKNELRYLIDNYLSKEKIEKFDVLNSDYVENLKKEFFAGRDFHYNKIWQLINLQIFLEKNI